MPRQNRNHARKSRGRETTALRGVVPAAAAGLIGLGAASGMAQGSPIFPGLLGDSLLAALVRTYKPSSVMSYDSAKDFMFGELDNVQDSVSCVYTGHTIYLNPFSDPSKTAEGQGINTEHTWPQSKGATGNAKSDLHHLFPTRDRTNSARGNLPFAELFDNAVDRWWREDISRGSVPTTFIAEYSEEIGGTGFEAREDHKGNVARAMFYFYTMYGEQADREDPNFFSRQKNTLRRWHSMDPVDPAERIRSEAVAPRQSGCINPFVEDTTLVIRAYFPELSAGDGDLPAPGTRAELLSASPNPFNPHVTISFELPESGLTRLEIFDVRGARVATLLAEQELGSGIHRLTWNAHGFPSGIYTARLEGHGMVSRTRLVLLR